MDFSIEIDISKFFKYDFAISKNLLRRVFNLINPYKEFYGSFKDYLNEFILKTLVHEVYCMNEEDRNTFFNRARSSCTNRQGTYLMSLQLALNSKADNEDYNYLFDTENITCIRKNSYDLHEYPSEEYVYYGLAPLVKLLVEVLVKEFDYSWKEMNLFIVAKLQEHVENEEDRLECVHDMYADMV